MKKIILVLASVFMLTSCIYEDYHHYQPSYRRPPYNDRNGRPPGPGNHNNGRPPRSGNHNYGRPPYNNGNRHNGRH